VQLDLSRRRLRSLASAPGSSAIAGLAATLRRTDPHSGRLLVVGPADHEPWHLVAHLQSPASIGPNVGLIRHTITPGPRAHLDIGLDDLAGVGRHDVVLFVGADDPGEELMQRLVDARHRSSALLALASDAPTQLGADLADAADEAVTVDATRLDGAQHLLSAFTTDRSARWPRRVSG
jgi:hypothetical protein